MNNIWGKKLSQNNKINRSENLEGLGDLSICVRDVAKVGRWNIYTEDGEWVTDESFEVKCVED